MHWRRVIQMTGSECDPLVLSKRSAMLSRGLPMMALILALIIGFYIVSRVCVFFCSSRFKRQLLKPFQTYLQKWIALLSRKSAPDAAKKRPTALNARTVASDFDSHLVNSSPMG